MTDFWREKKFKGVKTWGIEKTKSLRRKNSLFARLKSVDMSVLSIAVHSGRPLREKGKGPATVKEAVRWKGVPKDEMGEGEETMRRRAGGSPQDERINEGI